MWNALEENPEENVTLYKLEQDGKQLSFRETIAAMETSPEFGQFLTGLLQKSPYKAFFWEVKPVNEQTLDQPFEFVLVNSPMLANLKADSSPFDEYLEEGAEVVSFSNLRGDARLVVPVDISRPANYCHLADFVRKAPAEQVEKFWQRVALEYKNTIGEKTKWLSTSGLGVYWLHVRIDSTPKYYRYQAYKTFTHNS